MYKLMTMRSGTIDTTIWNMVPPQYLQGHHKTYDGGVKCTTKGTYLSGFLEFLRTMDRLNIPEKLSFTFPTPDVILQIYIVDCVMIRKGPNVWDTVRNKLRSIDWCAQMAGTKQCWSDNPALYASVQWSKRHRPGKGSDTLPTTAPILKRMIDHVMTTKVYGNLQLTESEKQLSARWMSFDKIWRDPTRRWWYIWAVSLLTLTVLGLRGAECYKNKDPDYEGYGLMMDDVKVYWRYAKSIYPNNTLSTANDPLETATDHLHHIQIRLRSWKTGYVGQNTFLRIGRTHREIEPALILYHLYQLRLTQWNGHCKKEDDDGFLFSAGTQDFTLKEVKKQLKRIVWETVPYERERYRFHGTRKGFAMTLLRNGTAIPLIAFAGRWKIKAAIGRYLIYSQKDLLQIAKLFLYGTEVNVDSIDFDEEEQQIIGDMARNGHQLDENSFKNTDGLYDEQIQWD